MIFQKVAGVRFTAYAVRWLIWALSVLNKTLCSFLRLCQRFQRPCSGALSGRHLAVGHYLPGVPDEEEAGASGRGLRVRETAAQYHLPQLQLHGSAPAVRVAGPGHFLFCRGRQPFRHSRPQVFLHPHVTLHLQLPRVSGDAQPAQQPLVPTESHHNITKLLIHYCLSSSSFSICQCLVQRRYTNTFTHLSFGLIANETFKAFQSAIQIRSCHRAEQ